MTSPALYTTFDTSVIDTFRSYTPTETSQDSHRSGDRSRPQQNETELMTQTQRSQSPDKTPTERDLAYNNDAKLLQTIDNIQFHEVIRQLMHILHTRPSNAGEPLKILNLSCGTGGTTLTLLQQPWNRPVAIEAWDGSAAKLSQAESSCRNVVSATRNVTSIQLRQVELTEPGSFPSHLVNAFDLVVSTLALEHVPLRVYWSFIARLSKKGGVGFVSNVHPDMGLARAYDSRSFTHSVRETVDAARQAGLDVVGDVREVTITEEMLTNGTVDPRARKYWGTKVWSGFTYQKR